MPEDNNLDFLNKNNNQDLFKQVDEERKKQEQQDINTNITSDEFIKSLPDWDLPPLVEKVRRVNRQ